MNFTRRAFIEGNISFLILCTIPFLILSVLFSIPLVIGILPGLGYLLWIVKRKKASWKEILNSGIRGLDKNKEVLFLLLFLAILLPSLVTGGATDSLTNIAVHVISIKYFFMTAFFIAMFVSMLLGSTIGTLSIIGIPIMNLGMEFDLPLEIVAGALLSGAFVGDRTSPLSGAFNLVLTTLGISRKTHFFAILPSTLLSVGTCMMLFIGLDLSVEKTMLFTTIFVEKFTLNNMISLLPIVILIGCLLFRMKLIHSFICSLVVSFLLNTLLYHIDLLELLKNIWGGIKPVGGLGGSLNFILFVALTAIFTQWLEDYHLLDQLKLQSEGKRSSLGRHTIQSVKFGALLSIVSPNQSFPIIIAGNTLKEEWREHGLGNLSRIISDTVLLFAGIVPWSLLAVVSASIVKVDVIAYVPFAVFIWISPLITILYAYSKEWYFKRRVQVG
ncbi:Na+/H+ antiporter NhaC family protein [Peribacillus alkalitolerans]|uniref:Na+/H+ antiporter NhaC family protein n=1 Tax=Peribacillus alkalitolerans TaxID=1550385 RepID=UPI0013D1B441|nr:Na+/H+ antiporter NhaC family protein [Peribacillus alkalitolerans]